MTKEYNVEEIWERLYHRQDLKKFRSARDFKKALQRDSRSKNLLKIGKRRLEKLYNYGVAQRLLEKDEYMQRSMKDYSEKQQRQISAYKGELVKSHANEEIFKKAESKGFSIFEYKTRESMLGRPTTRKTVKENITLARFKQGPNRYLAIYQKGHSGMIAKIVIKRAKRLEK